MAASYVDPKGQSNMADLTVVILTKNEEKNLRKCVESFCGAAKRFVIVDSGSTDETETLCSQLDRELRVFGSRLDFYYHPWNSYADQLNWGLDNTQISTEWSMRMDADEELLPEDEELFDEDDELPVNTEHFFDVFLMPLVSLKRVLPHDVREFPAQSFAMSR